MKPIVTWVLVADGKSASILSYNGPGHRLTLVPGMTFKTELHASRDLGTDKPGRVQESGYSAHHSVETPDYHRIEKTVFAQHLAHRLDAAIESGECKRLVLVAPPQTLGELRMALTPKAREHVIGEVHKDLTHLGPQDVATHLEKVLAI
ncbi:host attachment protein [Hypericibacter sp.]|uniref:host attachment protein n=1 Tax=Hypericibacter sp. TaxID=2705401 RepID=UPI003D6C7C47